MGQVEGKVAIVTGGAAGIGAACAETLAREGANLVVTDLDDARERAYRGVGLVALEGSQHRTDIALKAARGLVTVPGASAPRPRQEQA